MKYVCMITERIYVHKGKSRKGHFLDSCGVPTQGKLKDFETSTKFKRPECTRLPLEELQSQKFTGGACARNSLEKCVLRNPDVYYISRTPLSQNAPSAPGSTVLQ